VGALLFATATRARAEPLRLRGDALVQSNTPSPVGLLVLRGEDRLRPWIDAETVAWLGVTDQPSATGDVLSLSVRARDLASGSEVRAGRMLVGTGAIRPLHLDGLRALGRFSGGTSAEVFGGVPVVRRFGYRDFDFATGGRLAQAFGDRATLGVSYLHRRKDGTLADEEVGADAAFTPERWFTAAARWAFDLTNPGTADALGSISMQNADLRGEVFATHRSAGRLLPATSLFSMLGDYAATTVGATGRYRMFPRLDVVATGSGQVQDGAAGGQGLVRTTLALDDEWAGTLGIEARRVHFGTARWTGVRTTFTKPLGASFRVGAELELVVPDRPNGRGSVWPWALGAIGWRPARAWDVAVALEASRGPEYDAALATLLRATYVFEERRR